MESSELTRPTACAGNCEKKIYMSSRRKHIYLYRNNSKCWYFVPSCFCLDRLEGEIECRFLYKVWTYLAKVNMENLQVTTETWKLYLTSLVCKQSKSAMMCLDNGRYVVPFFCSTYSCLISRNTYHVFCYFEKSNFEVQPPDVCFKLHTAFWNCI